MDQKKLAHLTKLWQKRLRLQDWQVTTLLVPDSEMPELLGEIPLDGTELKATLHINKDLVTPDNMESTIVHELLHLRLLPFSDGSFDEPDHDNREVAINLLASVLLRAFTRPTRRKRQGTNTI